MTTRRAVLGTAVAALGARRIVAAAPPLLRAVAYDGFTLFDPRPIAALAARLFPQGGPELMNLWRTKQFDYQWLRALSGRYQDFWRVTESALLHAARSLHLELQPAARDALMGAWLKLEAWPDVPPALRSLKDAGLRQAPLANIDREILDAAIRNSRLEGIFDAVISTGSKMTFKPDPRAYQLGVDALGLPREQILFVPSAGWDAAGSRWFGYPTLWVNRSGAPPEELDAGAIPAVRGMAELVAFATKP